MPFNWRNPIKPVFVTPPAESPVDELDVAARVMDIDDKLRRITEIPPTERGPGLYWQADKLLDQRNAIRPAQPRKVPYIPGRS